MTVRQQWSIVGLFVLVAGGVLFAATRILGDELFPVSVGSRAPDFHAQTMATPARARSLGDYRGQVVLLNIWATWCAPCRIEMPGIEKLQRALGPDGLKIVAVSIDDPGNEQAIRDFARQYGLSFEILHDETGAIKTRYQTTGVPETFIIGRDGVIRKKVIGATEWDSDANRALIQSLLREPAS
ncbi:MAG TPA: TlpA disulfide reductase family protein [Gemmatimonadaceae bacterium]|nr:TlpA disulfide reductase family protein [Gemmatimonadaceae bacterium]